MGTYRKLSSGSWNLRECVGKEDGKRVYKSFTGPTKKECKRQLELWTAAGGKEELKSKAGYTVADALQAYITTCERQGSSPSTVRGYLSSARNAFPTLSSVDITSVTVDKVQKAVDDLAEDHSPKSVRNAFYLLQPALKRVRPDLDLDTIKLNHKKKRPKLILDDQLGARVLDYAWEHESRDTYLYASLIISAGIRPSEAYALTWGQISKAPLVTLSGLKLGSISIESARVKDKDGVYVEKEPKTSAGYRRIEVSWSMIEDMEAARPRGADEEQILHTLPCMTKPWQRIRKALGLPETMRFYDLRHLYATDVATSGATEDELKARLGHETSGFSHSVYVELFAGRQQTINETLARRAEKRYCHRKCDKIGDTNPQKAL